MKKRLKSLLIGLAFGMTSCSQYELTKKITYLTMSKNNNINIFGGVEEGYNPIRLSLEIGNAFLYVPFVGFEGNEFEIGFDVGLKQRLNGWHSKEFIGLGYVSKKFKEHEFRQNIHLGFGVGKEISDYSVGLIYEHYSMGNSLTRRDLSRRNDGINTIGLQVGVKF